jgi:hypothetical protein
LVTKLPWAKSILAFDGKIVQVWCKVFIPIEVKEKFLVPKLDSCWKHANPCKVCLVKPKVKVGKHYFLKTNAHVANEKLYVAKVLK